MLYLAQSRYLFLTFLLSLYQERRWNPKILSLLYLFLSLFLDSTDLRSNHLLVSLCLPLMAQILVPSMQLLNLLHLYYRFHLYQINQKPLLLLIFMLLLILFCNLLLWLFFFLDLLLQKHRQIYHLVMEL